MGSSPPDPLRHPAVCSMKLAMVRYLSMFHMGCEAFLHKQGHTLRRCLFLFLFFCLAVNSFSFSIRGLTFVVHLDLHNSLHVRLTRQRLEAILQRPRLHCWECSLKPLWLKNPGRCQLPMQPNGGNGRFRFRHSE